MTRARKRSATTALCGLMLACVLLLAGCGWHGTGTVKDKRHTDSYWTTNMVCATYDFKTGACTVWMPQTQEWPETWELLIHADDGDHWVDVNSADYQTKIGAVYTVKEG